MSKFDLHTLVTDLRAAAAGEEPAVAVRKLMTDAFREPAAIRAAMTDFKTEYQALFEDDSVSIWYSSFQPGMHVPPHDHRTTAVIGVYDGVEINHFYLREPGRLVPKSARRLAAGDVIALRPDAIHSVEADGDRPCLGIHVYLGPLTRIERSIFDWESGAATAYTDAKLDAMTRPVD